MPLYGPSGGGSVVKIQEIICGSSQASLSFSSISGSYRSLMLHMVGQFTVAGASFQRVQAQFNGDTASNYDSMALFTQGATPTFNARNESAATVGWFPQASAQAGCIELLLPNYAATTFRKVGRSTGIVDLADTTVGQLTLIVGFVWRSTAALTSILVLPESGAGSFATGTTAALYGLL